jgi:hypothetical protein
MQWAGWPPLDEEGETHNNQIDHRRGGRETMAATVTTAATAVVALATAAAVATMTTTTADAVGRMATTRGGRGAIVSNSRKHTTIK